MTDHDVFSVATTTDFLFKQQKPNASIIRRRVHRILLFSTVMCWCISLCGLHKQVVSKYVYTLHVYNIIDREQNNYIIESRYDSSGCILSRHDNGFYNEQL